MVIFRKYNNIFNHKSKFNGGYRECWGLEDVIVIYKVRKYII
jgi:hypothetical protein